MPVNKRVLVAIGSAAGVLVLFMIIVIVVTHQTGGLIPGISQKCPANVTKCKDYTEKEELFHAESGKCFRKGEDPEGICGENMAILPMATCLIEGQCECAYNKHDRGLIYHPETARCYFIFQQGWCGDGERIALSQNGTGICEKDSCLKDKQNAGPDSEGDWVPFKGRCFKLYSELNEPDCKGTLRFWKGKVNPACDQPPIISTSGVGAVPSANCPPGSFQAVNGYCTPGIEFDFD